MNPAIGSAAQTAWAIAGAIGGSLWLILGGRGLMLPSLAILISMAGAVTAYGFALFVGTTAIALLHTQHLLGGLGLLSLCGLYLWLTVNSLAIGLHEIRNAPGTWFMGANLTHASFTNVEVSHADFSQAIGWIKSQPVN